MDTKPPGRGILVVILELNEPVLIAGIFTTISLVPVASNFIAPVFAVVAMLHSSHKLEKQ
ncbi:MAG: hypothetical protein M0P64_02940 [Candidatus Pacebacteria bacterium]|jgi:hypothetical protein|nr:hypothetical protein [Candidatus Paceibacterota bacterium]